MKKFSAFARLKYQGLALASEYLRNKELTGEYDALASSEAHFKAVWEDFWPMGFDALVTSYQNALNEDITIWALARSGERFQRTLEWFQVKMVMKA